MHVDRHLIGMQNRLLGPPAKFLADRGIRADWITLFGFMVGLCAVPLLALSAFIPALICILFNRLLDGLDGAVARQLGPTDRGAFLDIAYDFFFYGGCRSDLCSRIPTQTRSRLRCCSCPSSAREAAFSPSRP